MSDCKESVSPKLDEASMEGDSEELDEDQKARFRQRANGYSKHGASFVYEAPDPTVLEMRLLKRLSRNIRVLRTWRQCSR